MAVREERMEEAYKESHATEDVHRWVRPRHGSADVRLHPLQRRQRSRGGDLCGVRTKMPHAQGARAEQEAGLATATHHPSRAHKA